MTRARTTCLYQKGNLQYAAKISSQCTSEHVQMTRDDVMNIMKEYMMQETS